MLKYLWYILKHKWYVFVYGRGVPFLRLLVHDWSKFTPLEFLAYRDKFYSDRKDEPQVKRAFKYAWLNHLHHNPHHWQYWILQNDEGGLEVLEMPRSYILEMIADWKSAGKVITGKEEAREWYDKNKERILLHPNTQKLVETLL